MSQKTEDEILKQVGDVQKSVGDIKSLVSPSNAAIKTELDTKATQILAAVKAGPETSKNIFESLFEALGLKDVFSAFKDGGDPFSKLLLAVGAIATLVLGKLLDFGKIFNTAFEKISRSLANRNLPEGQAPRPGRVMAIGESGLPQRMTRAEMDGLNAVSINPHGISAQQLSGLRNALDGLPPKIREFNSATADMKSAGTIGKLATAVGKLKDKLDASPTNDIDEAATAIGHLHTQLEHFNPNSLPKAQTLRGIATAARELHDSGDNLQQMFQRLATQSTAAAGAIAGGTGSGGQ